MLGRHRTLLLAFTLLAALAALVPCAAAATGRGDDPKGKPVVAPHLLEGVDWGKARTHKRFQRGTIYVLDFWTPWLELSRDALPYLKSLRQKYAQDRLVFISIGATLAGSSLTPQAFLEKRASLFENVVVRDIGGKTLGAYDGAGVGDDLPNVVIVDRLGNIAWWGSPFEDVAGALDAVLANDSPRATELMKTRKAEIKAAKPDVDAFNKNFAAGNWPKALADVDKLIAMNARRDVLLPRWRYEILVMGAQKDEAAAYGRTLVDSTYAEMEFELDLIASFIEGAKIPDEVRDLDLALLAAEKARTLSAGKDTSILDTLARVHFKRGDFDKAVAAQTEAVAQAGSHDEREWAQTVLKAYQEKRAPPTATRSFDFDFNW